MDYKTKPTSRADLRKYSQVLRKLFNVPLTGAFPVLFALEKLPGIFKDCDCMVVDDDKLPATTMAQCSPNDKGGFTIEIKDSVYLGAYEKNIGAYLGFICHEICHIFLFKIGFTPLFERSFETGVLPAYCSVEWQAKALCAEVMIPYYDSLGMLVDEIIDTYVVSKAFAKNRVKLGDDVP